MKDNVEIEGTSELRKVILEALREPDVRLDALRDQWEKTGNPLFVWKAIALCAQRELPDWVRRYLSDCAHRVPQALADSRKALPTIMGFAGKRGPRPVFDDELAADDWVASALFYHALATGSDLADALTKVEQFLEPTGASRDEFTLCRWLAKAFELDTVPRTIDTWRKALGL